MKMAGQIANTDKQARALGNLERLARIGGKTADIGNVAGQLRQLPARATNRTFGQLVESGIAASRQIRLESSRNWFRGLAGSMAADPVNARDRGTAMLDSGGRLHLDTQEFTSAMNALSRVERAAVSGIRGPATSDVGRRATRAGVRSSDDFTARVHRAIRVAPRLRGANAESLETADAGLSSRSRAALTGNGLVANAQMASSNRGMLPSANISRREFAEPMGDGRGRNGGGLRAGITINSSPTVVINATAGGGGVERDAINALRAHREELFNQLQRESARRERARF